MQRSLLISGVVALTLALALPLALARGPGDGPRGDHGARMTQALGLSTQQAETMKKLRDLHQSEVKATFEQIGAKQDALRELWRAAKPDRAKLVTATQEITALEAQLQVKRVDHLLSIQSVLTPEQFQKFLDLGPGMHGPGKRSHRGMRGMGMGPGGMGMGPGGGMGMGGGGMGMGPCGMHPDGPPAEGDDTP